MIGKKSVILAAIASATVTTWVASSDPSRTYPSLPGDYQSWTSQEKREHLWNRMTESAYSKDELPAFSGGWQSLKIASKSFLSVSFNEDSDQIPEGRFKLLHPFGTVAKVRFVPAENSPFTGIFASGAVGLARLSLAGNPGSIGYTPGMALKLFVDGFPSVNLHVMDGLDGQGENRNFFAFPFTNDLAAPQSEDWIKQRAFDFLEWRFSKVTSSPRHLGLQHLAAREADGSPVPPGQSETPYKIFFEPSTETTNLISQDTSEDIRVELSKKLAPGDALYVVSARMEDQPDDDKIQIGWLVMESRFLASDYGDRMLFFRHQRNDR